MDQNEAEQAEIDDWLTQRLPHMHRLPKKRSWFYKASEVAFGIFFVLCLLVNLFGPIGGLATLVFGEIGLILSAIGFAGATYLVLRK